MHAPCNIPTSQAFVLTLTSVRMIPFVTLILDRFCFSSHIAYSQTCAEHRRPVKMFACRVVMASIKNFSVKPLAHFKFHIHYALNTLCLCVQLRGSKFDLATYCTRIHTNNTVSNLTFHYSIGKWDGIYNERVYTAISARIGIEDERTNILFSSRAVSQWNSVKPQNTIYRSFRGKWNSLYAQFRMCNWESLVTFCRRNSFWTQIEYLYQQKCWNLFVVY